MSAAWRETWRKWLGEGEPAARSRGRARLALARRDLLEFVRDRRTLFVTLLLPMAMYPILALSSALGVKTALSDIDARQAPTPLAIVLSGRPWDARAFAGRIDALTRPESGRDRLDWPASSVFGLASADEARAAVEAGQADIWIEVPEGVIDMLDGIGTLELEIHGPQSRPLPTRTLDQTAAVMRRLAEEARQRRFGLAGLPESLLEPLTVRFTGKKAAAGAISARNLLPTVAGGVFVLLAVLTMTGAFYPAIDAIAGEKERGTIETLLIAPCAAIDIVAGKFLAVWAVALATLVANVVSIILTTAVSLRFLPGGESLLPEGHLPLVAGISLLAFVGLSAVAAAMCLAVTTASKSGKEAQNTLTPVLLVASALAGAGLVTKPGQSLLVPAVPFAGQVALARATLEPHDAASGQAAAASSPRPAGLPERPATPEAALSGLAWGLALSLISSAVVVWLLLRATAALLTDEEILFRGPDVAGSVFARPARRRRPSVGQALATLAAGLAGLWYAQGVAPADLVLAIPVQQAVAVGLPLAVLLAWQRVDLRTTFGLRRPCAAAGREAWRPAASVAGAALVGAGIFFVGAAVLLAVRGSAVSPEARSLAEKLVGLMRERPVWLSWALMAVVPAVCEEALFRGWVQSALVGGRPGRGRAVAGISVQAACFAVFHLLPERMPQTFVLGLVAGTLVLATGSLLPAIVCHAAHNSMPLVLLWMAGGATGADAVAVSAATAQANLSPGTVVAALAAVVVGAAAIWLAARRPAVRGPSSAGAAFCLACLVVAAGSAVAGAADPEPSVNGRPLRVAVLPIASAVEWQGDEPTGLMIRIWDDLARRLDVQTRYLRAETFMQLMNTLPTGEADVALGPIAITEERERILDLTHPIFHSGLRIAVRPQGRSGFVEALWSLASWPLLALLGVVLALVLVSGHLLWWFERRVNPESFPHGYVSGVWEAIWWIASTIVVGGCDNKHVVSVLGRALAFAWMVGGIVLLASFTSVLTATLTAEQVAGAIHGPRDLAGRTVGCQEGAVTVKSVRQRGGGVREYARIDDALVALDAGEVEAVVSENQQLMHLLSQTRFADLKIVGPLFESFDYGLGLPAGSPLRERLNAAILRMREDGSLDRMREEAFGRHE